MTERTSFVSATDIVGQEGLAPTVSALASQLSALEKSTNYQFNSLSAAVVSAAEAVRRETAAEAQRLNTLLHENADKSNLKTEALRMEVAQRFARTTTELQRIEDAAQLALATYRESARQQGDIIISKYDGVIATMNEGLRGEAAAQSRFAEERMERLQEVKNLHWHEHSATHLQQEEAVRVAVTALDKRLDAMNEFRNALTEQASRFVTATAVDSEKADTRRRFELVEAKLNTLEKEMGRELRSEVRPVQDAKVGQSAIIAAMVVGVSILGVLIVLANYLSARGG